MLANDPTYLKAIADLSREMIATFGEQSVHVFGWQAAKTAKGGTKAVGTGEDAGKKPRYGAAAVRALSQSSGGEEKEGTLPSRKDRVPDEAAKQSTLAKLQPINDQLASYAGLRSPGLNAQSKIAELKTQQAALADQLGATKPARPTAAPVRASAPARASSTPGGPKRLNGTNARVSMGPKPSERMAREKAAAKIPPASPAETKALDNYHTKDTKNFGPRAAGILRGAAAALRGLMTLGGLVSGTAAGAGIGGLVGGPLGMAVGTAIGGGLGGLAGSRVPLAGAFGRAEANQSGPIARRRAGFSESFAEDLPPNAVAVLKARLKLMARKAGVTLPEIPDEVIAKALSLASNDPAIATSTNLSECVKLADRISRR